MFCSNIDGIPLSNPTASVTGRTLNEDDFIQPIPQIDITIDYETFYKSGELTAESITQHLDGTNIFLALKDNYLMLELREDNTSFEKENFEFEVFESGSASDGYIQLSFTPESDTEFIAPTVNNVEYFMNIVTDGDIPNEVLEELNINEDAVRVNIDRVKLNRDLYYTAWVDVDTCWHVTNRSYDFVIAQWLTSVRKETYDIYHVAPCA